MANPLYDKTYTDTRTISGISITTKFESHINPYDHSCSVSATVKSGTLVPNLMCIMYFDTYILVQRERIFSVTNEYATTQSVNNDNFPDPDTGIVPGRVQVMIYTVSGRTINTLGVYDVSYSDIFVHIDTSIPTLDRLNVTTNYLGTIPSVDIKVSQPYLSSATFSIKDLNNTAEEFYFDAEDGVAETIDTRWAQSNLWLSGHSYAYSVFARIPHRELITVDQGTITFESRVEKVVMDNLSQMSAGQTQQVRYTLKKPDGATGPFKYPGVTFTSSNTSVATVNSSGVITAVANGRAEITVTSDDTWAVKADHKTLIVTATPGAIPILEDDYTQITKDDIDDFLTLEELLKVQLSPGTWVTITFDGYTQSIFTIYELIDDIIYNMQSLTAKYLINNPSSATAQALNAQAQHCSIDRENYMLPGQSITAWRNTFRIIAQTLTALADLVL